MLYSFDMIKETFVSLLCEKLNVDKYSIAKKKYGTAKEVTYGALLEAIYDGETIPGIATCLGISVRTTNRILNEYAFPQIDKVEGKPWKARLLELIDYKTCNICNETKSTSEFHLYPSNTISSKHRSGFMYRCKSCDTQQTLSKYKFYPYIHRAANNKYRALKQNPSSMDLCNPELVTLIYKQCPTGYVVDHIIPLCKGGGHNEFNLCYLTARDNMVKAKRMPEEVPEIMERAIFPLEVEGLLK